MSALIHAATMVTAGVLPNALHPLFDLAPVAQGMVACVGIGTALMAGVIAPSQVDIKRVIAYSTMSQIGLMIYAVGIGAYSAGMFHFAMHAVFKALLFMAAGNVIHALHDEQDIRLMGGVAAKMRRTELCFLSGTFSLAGIPFFAGFFSKEDLLGFGLTNGPRAVLGRCTYRRTAHQRAHRPLRIPVVKKRLSRGAFRRRACMPRTRRLR